MVGYTSNPSTQKAEVGLVEVQDWPELYSEILFQDREVYA